MNKYFYLLFICGKKNRITELKMPPVIHLTGEKVETILPRCYETGVLVDSFLVLKEKCTDTMFYLFSTNTDREIPASFSSSVGSNKLSTSGWR